MGAYVILRGLRSCRGYFPPPPPGSTPPPPARNESAARTRLAACRIRNPNAAIAPGYPCVGAVWAVNKPGRDARRLDHGKSKERGGAGPPTGVSAVRGGPWPRTCRTHDAKPTGAVPRPPRPAPWPRGHKVHNCQLPAPVPRSLPRRDSARRSPRARAHGQPEPLSLGVRCPLAARATS